MSKMTWTKIYPKLKCLVWIFGGGMVDGVLITQSHKGIKRGASSRVIKNRDITRWRKTTSKRKSVYAWTHTTTILTVRNKRNYGIGGVGWWFDTQFITAAVANVLVQTESLVCKLKAYILYKDYLSLVMFIFLYTIYYLV